MRFVEMLMRGVLCSLAYSVLYSILFRSCFQSLSDESARGRGGASPHSAASDA